MYICQEVNYRPTNSKVRKDLILVYKANVPTKRNSYGRTELVFVVEKSDVVIPNFLKIGCDIMELPRMDINYDFYSSIKDKVQALTWGILMRMSPEEEV